MSGRISWSISFDGLDAQIAKLRTLDTILNSISRKGGLLGGGTRGINIGGQGGTTFIGGVPSGTGAGASSATVAGLAAGVTAGESVGSTRATKLKSESIPIELRNFVNKSIGNKGITDKGYEKLFTRYGMEGVKAFNQIRNERIARRKGIKESGVPTVISPDYIKRINHLQESTILRNIKASGIGIGRNLGEMAGKGPMGASIASGLLTKLTSPLALVIAAFLVLHTVTKLLIEGIKHGAEAYQHAAKMGGDVGSHFALTEAFKAIGMEGIDTQALQGQFNPKAKKFGVPDSDMVLGAAKAGQFGNVQQLTNMSEEFKRAMERATDSAERMGKVAYTAQKITTAGSEVSVQWKTMLTQLAAAFYPLIRLIQGLSIGLVNAINTILEGINWLEKKLHIQPGVGPNFSQIGASMGKSGPSFTSWEKMGFQFGKSANDPLHNIASNTKETVRAINNLTKEFKGGGGSFGGQRAGGSWNMLTGISSAPSMA